MVDAPAPGSATNSRRLTVSSSPGKVVTVASSRETTVSVSSSSSTRTTTVDDDDGSVAHHRRDRDDGAAVVDLGRAHLDAVGCEVQRAGAEQPHVPVDPGAAVPPGVIAGSHRHHDLVLGTESQQMIDRHVEGRVAGWTVRGDGTVHGDHGVAVHALEQQHERVARLLGRDVERRPVLPRAGREVAGRRPTPTATDRYRSSRRAAASPASTPRRRPSSRRGG